MKNPEPCRDIYSQNMEINKRDTQLRDIQLRDIQLRDIQLRDTQLRDIIHSSIVP